MLDGMCLNDNFGFNLNGYLIESILFLYDVIEQVVVELVFFDVEYGGFIVCNINVVIKFGINEVYGFVFYDFIFDLFKGDLIEGNDIDNGNYIEKCYGFIVGLLLISDKLFLFGVYEKKEGVCLYDYVGLVCVSEVEFFEILCIFNEVYGYDLGGFKGFLLVEDEKLLLKVDWNINEDYCVVFIYNWNDGYIIFELDIGFL